MARYRESPILDAVYPQRKKRWVPSPKRMRENVELVVKKFSFLDNPDGTLDIIKKIAVVESKSLGALLHFDDDLCGDIGAFLVLSEFWNDMAPIFIGGRMSPSIQKVFASVGLRRAMRITIPLDSLNDIWAFPIKRRRPTGSSTSRHRFLEPQTLEHVADEFFDALDKWLATCSPDVQLTTVGRSKFVGIITELLDNAERHSDPRGGDGSWSIAAFMARRFESGKPVYRCYIAILSVGSTISESILAADKHVLDDMEKYVEKHKKVGLSEETLRMLFAIQDGVTRDQDARKANRGGIGMQDVVSFIDELANSKTPDKHPKITIMSGRSCIKLREPYFCGKKRGIMGPREMWCNPANDPHQPPDNNVVFDTRERLAGTVVSMSFVLDPNYLRALANV